MDENTKKQCSNCKCWRNPDDYIGKSGSKVKRCIKCREKDARQKQRPEVKEKRNERAKEKKYSQINRAKKREEDAEVYLAVAAKQQKDWRNNNKEHLSKYSMTSVNRRLCAIKGQANKKGYVWELTDDKAKLMMTTECFYCGYLDLETTVNGIDRMYNTVGYTPDNCVACCSACNFMKKALDALTFVERCRQISSNHGGPGETHTCWLPTTCVRFTEYKRRASKKELSFEITKQDFDDICSQSCEYCGRESKDGNINGIDRKDNDIGYQGNNCIACCYQCNISKRDIPYDVYISKCILVASKEHNIPDMPRCLYIMNRRVQKT